MDTAVERPVNVPKTKFVKNTSDVSKGVSLCKLSCKNSNAVLQAEKWSIETFSMFLKRSDINVTEVYFR
jgi:hypothetical protein